MGFGICNYCNKVGGGLEVCNVALLIKLGILTNVPTGVDLKWTVLHVVTTQLLPLSAIAHDP